MSVIKKIRSYLSYKSELKDNWEAKEETIKWSIYNNKKKESSKEIAKRFSFAHKLLKYTLVMPGAVILEKLLGKRLSDDIPDYWYNQNLKILSKSIDDTMINLEHYKDGVDRINDGKQQRVIKNGVMKKLLMKRHYQIIRLLKKIFFTIVLNDTFYRNFIDCFSYTLANNMHEAYDGKKVNHVYYGGKSMINLDYYIIGRIVSEGKKQVTVRIEKVKKNKDFREENETDKKE